MRLIVVQKRFYDAGLWWIYVVSIATFVENKMKRSSLQIFWYINNQRKIDSRDS